MSTEVIVSYKPKQELLVDMILDLYMRRAAH